MPDDSKRQPDDSASAQASPEAMARQQAQELRAQNEMMQSEQRLLERQRREIRKQIAQKRFKVLIWQGVLGLRKLSDRINPWRPGTFLVAATVFATFCVLIIPKFIVFLLGAVLGAAIFAPLFLFPPDNWVWWKQKDLSDEVARATEEYKKFSEDFVQHAGNAAKVEKKYEETAEDLRRKQLLESTGGRRQSLQNRNWKALRGAQFEKFVTTIFEELGFEIEAPARGSRGVDFIAARPGRRICVQIQTEDGGASERAVQNVHYARGPNRCASCAVITNRQATLAAKELALAIDCIVVDEDSMQSLILGEVVQ